MHAPPNQKLESDDTFKFMLSFDHDKVLHLQLSPRVCLSAADAVCQFLTPWIIISDSKARLVLCKITFKCVRTVLRPLPALFSHILVLQA